jgi:uracil-DNA glycosylase family 4
MFIGEAPGFHEDRNGEPFVGAAGKFLNEMLEAIDLDRSSVYITNVVKCRPPGNRDPLPDEIAACSGYIDRQIELNNPKVDVTLGRFSMSRWFPKERISRIWDPYVTSKPGGTGLGLAIVRQTIAAHNGEVEAESAPGRGTTVRLILPAEAARARETVLSD